MAYNTGWRTSEIKNLTWDRVDLKKGTVRLETGQTKNDEGQTIYMDDNLLSLLKSQMTKRRLGCKHVFHRAGMGIKKFEKAWNKACKETGIEGNIFYDLRRTAVRNMVRAGIPEQVAMKTSGHKSRTVFDRYNIVNPNDLKQAAQKIGEYHEMVTNTVINGENGQNVENAKKAQVINIDEVLR